MCQVKTNYSIDAYECTVGEVVVLYARVDIDLDFFDVTALLLRNQSLFEV